MIFFFLLLVLVLIAQIAEFFIPALPWLYNAHIYIVPVIVFYGAMALPFPLMLALALYAGLLLDALTVQVIGGKVEISMGSSILLYAVLSGLMHGLRPLFARGRWEVHCILSGICTSLRWRSHRSYFGSYNGWDGLPLIHIFLKGTISNEQTPHEFAFADSISCTPDADRPGLPWP